MTSHPFESLPARGKEPRTKRHLDGWVAHGADETGMAVRRLGWIVASSVVVAALQRALHDDGRPIFLLKGGAYLEVRLGLATRATKDVDTLFRGDFDKFLDSLDEALREPWGALELQRTEIEVIEGARRVVKPRRFKIKLLINGQTWRSIDVEVSPDEGGAGAGVDLVKAPPLDFFGLPSPGELAGIAPDYQIAQKIHACTDPHQPPDQVNDRARDVVDILLLKETFYGGDEDLTTLRAACADVFEARSADARALALEERRWPPIVAAHDHWRTDFESAAGEIGIEFTLDAAVAEVNTWIESIDGAS